MVAAVFCRTVCSSLKPSAVLLKIATGDPLPTGLAKAATSPAASAKDAVRHSSGIGRGRLLQLPSAPSFLGLSEEMKTSSALQKTEALGVPCVSDFTPRVASAQVRVSGPVMMASSVSGCIATSSIWPVPPISFCSVMPVAVSHTRPTRRWPGSPATASSRRPSALIATRTGWKLSVRRCSKMIAPSESLCPRATPSRQPRYRTEPSGESTADPAASRNSGSVLMSAPVAVSSTRMARLIARITSPLGWKMALPVCSTVQSVFPFVASWRTKPPRPSSTVFVPSGLKRTNSMFIASHSVSTLPVAES
jgi:hypothetical protein